MATGWFLCPYKRRPERHGYARYCAMDDLTPGIHSAGGDWAEADVGAGQTIVRLRAPSALVASAGLLFQQLSETEARSIWSPTLILPRYDSVQDRLTFDGKVGSTRSLDDLIRAVSEPAPSRELLGLIAAWTALGFGQGWRLPYWFCLFMAVAGRLPTDLSWIERVVLFGIRGGAFPTTGTLDAFNRADEGPLSDGGNWTNPAISGDNSLRVVGNQCGRTAAGGTFGSAYRSNTTYGPDSEAFADLAVLTGSASLEFMARLQSPGTAALDGYFVHCNLAGSTMQCWEINDNGQTQLGASAAQTYATDDALGTEVTGGATTTVKGFRKPSGGSWTEILSRNDTVSPITAAGNIGQVIEGADHRIDNFSGGTLAAAGVAYPGPAVAQMAAMLAFPVGSPIRRL